MTDRDLDRVLDGLSLGDVFDRSDYYPGSKQRRSQPQHPVLTAEDVAGPFDGVKPRIYQVKGKPVEFFTIGQLAAALGRSAVTLRKWERDGTLPKATFVAPNPKRDHRAKRRLYSRAQCTAILEIAMEEGILSGTKISKTQFSERVLNAFKHLAEDQRNGTSQQRSN